MKKIVLTGGESAAMLERIVEHFSGRGYCVLTVPEGATLFARSGVDFQTSNEEMFLESQRQLLEFQLEMEERMERIAQHSSQPVLMLCDHGTMDIRACLPDAVWQRILAEMGMSVVELRDARYDAVLHISTAAKSAEHIFPLVNNTVLSGSSELARTIGDRLMAAWTGHPHLRVIDGNCGFEEMINRVITEISHILSDQPIEIERKYLVEVVREIPNGNVSDIWQTYLLPADGHERRLRRRGEGGHYIYFLTTKIRIAADRSYEHEKRISESEYKKLLAEANPAKQTIHKKRCCFLWENQYFELDTFLTPRLPYCMMEIEDAESPEDVSFPPFIRVVRDVTGNPAYSNSNIARL